jgi:predicted ATPase with chaperone activity
MLDLVYNPTSRTYKAPLQMKSNGGVSIVDDLGRQAEPPQALINRWIVPLEENKDILALQSGEKFEVPFDTLVIFSTNFHPNEIFDKAACAGSFSRSRSMGRCRRTI